MPFGRAPVNDRVISELNTRGNVLKNPNKTPDQLTYLNANGPWIVLQSGINLSENLYDDPTGSPDTAKSYVLTGGRIGSRAGIDLSGKGSAEAAYYNGSFGLRPLPGITGVTVRNRDTFGAVLEADIKIKVYSLEDLDKMDRVYFKPGYSAVLEWGWTLTWDNKYDRLVADKPVTVDFFGREKIEELIRTVEDEAKPLRNPNHEILIGYITNFSFTLCSDGTYDCSLKILSTGSVLEGLKISALRDSQKPMIEDRKKADDEEDLTSSWLSPIREIIAITGDQKGEELTLSEICVQNGLSEELGGNLFKEITVRGYTVAIGRRKNKSKRTVGYITMRSLLKLLNEYELVNRVAGYEFDVEEEGRYDNRYRTTISQFSLDPYKAVIPGRVSYVNTLESVGTVDGTVVSRKELGGKTVTEFKGTVGRIFDIWVSVDYLYDCILSQIESNESTFSFLNYFREMLSGLSKAFGNMNDFDLGIDTLHHKLYVVDRNYLQVSEMPEISTSGLDTSVIELKATSTVSSDMANMMSVVAQGSKDFDPSITSWNQGAVERHSLTASSYEQVKVKDKKIDKSTDIQYIDVSGKNVFWKEARNMYSKMFEVQKDSGVKTVSEIGAGGYEKIQLLGQNLFTKEINALEKVYKPASVSMYPVKLELTFKGIAGFVIGEAFAIKDGVLPSRYRNWGYIITGVEHTISPANWTTSVRTQFMPKESTGEDFDQKIEKDIEIIQSSIWNYHIMKAPYYSVAYTDYDPLIYEDWLGYRIRTGDEGNGSIGYCARYAYWYAKILMYKPSLPSEESSVGTEYYSVHSINHILPRATVSRDLPPSGVGDAGTAKMIQDFRNIGYETLAVGFNKTGAEIEKDARKLMNPGDMITYWTSDRSKYHVCLRRIITDESVCPSKEWVSDFLQNNVFVYKLGQN